MQEIKVEEKINCANLVAIDPTTMPGARVTQVSEEGLACYLGEEKVIAARRVEVDEDFLVALEKLRFNNSQNMGILCQNLPFGFNKGVGRGDERAEYKLAPEARHYVYQTTKTVCALYQEEFPELYEEHLKATRKIPERFKIFDTPFCVGVINKEGNLRYHYDEGGYRGACTGAVIFQRGMNGGLLQFPELKLALDCNEKKGGEGLTAAVVVFKGGDLLHGVTAMHAASPNAYRYSLIYYALKHMEGED